MAEATLELDITPALSALDEISARFDEIVSGFSDQLANAVSSAMDPQLDALGLQFEGVADDFTAGLQSSLDTNLSLDSLYTQFDSVAETFATALQAAVEADPLDVPLDFPDVGGAAEGLDDVEKSLEDVGNGATQTMDRFTRLSGSATILAGTTSVLSGKAHQLLVNIAPQAAAYAGVAFAINNLIERGDRAILATERMQRVFGSDAPQVFDRRIAEVGMSLTELDRRAGVADTKLRMAVATFGQLAIGAGAAKKEAVDVAQRMGALANVVTVLNPSLGTADKIFQMLSRGLGGSTRILQRYGITIDAATLSQNALAHAQEAGREKASLYDKQVAGLALAFEALEASARKNGTTLKEELGTGLDSGTIKMRALKSQLSDTLEAIGVQLVPAALELAEAITPLVVELTKIAGVVVESVLPVLATLSKVLKPLSAVLGELHGAIVPIGVAFATMGLMLKTVVPLLGLFQIRMIASSGPVARLNAGIGALQQRLPVLAAAGMAVAVTVGDIGKSTVGTVAGIGAMTLAGAQLGAVVGQPVLGAAIGATTGLVVLLGKELFGAKDDVDQFAKAIDELAGRLSALGVKAAGKEFLGDIEKKLPSMLALTYGIAGGTATLGKEVDKAAVKFQLIRDHLKILGTSTPAEGRKVVDALSAMTDALGNPLLSAKQLQILNLDLAKSEKAFVSANKEKQKSSDVNANLINSTTTLTQKQKENTAAFTSMAAAAASRLPSATAIFDKLSSAADAANSRIKETLPSIASVFDKTISDINAGPDVKAKTMIDAESLLSGFQESLDTTRTFLDNQAVIFGAGFTKIGGLIREKGPETGSLLAQQLADGIRAGNIDLAAALDSTAGEFDSLSGKITTSLSPEELLAGFTENLALTKTFWENLKIITAGGFTAVAQVLVDKGPEQGAKLAQDLADGIRSGQPAVASALDEEARQVQGAHQGYSDWIRDTFGPAFLKENDVWLKAIPVNVKEKLGLLTGPDILNKWDTAGETWIDTAAASMRDAIPKLTAVDIMNKFDNVGEEWMTGIAGGITSSQPLLDAAAQAAANSALEAAMGPGGIDAQSPSKRTAREIGLPFSQGIAKGILAGAPLIASAATQAVGFDGLASLVGTTRSPLGFADAGGGRGQNVQIDRIDIKVEGVPDPVQAKAAGEALMDGVMLSVAKQNMRVAVRNA